MLPGPTNIRACPNCEQGISEPTLHSGNTFGSSLWSDGKFDAPMLSANPEIVKCPSCAHLFWLRDAEIVGQEDSFSISQARFWDQERNVLGEDGLPTYPQNGPYKSFVELTEDDYLKILADGSCTQDQERYVRITCWHVANDAYRRQPKSGKFEFSQDQKRNLEALKESLSDSDPHQLLMKAEIARELGLHDEAVDIISSASWNKSLDRIASKIRDKAVMRISSVFVLDGPNHSELWA